jgi:hypothetical protein
MSLVLEETRVEYRYTNKNGATIVIRNVPAKFLTDDDGETHETYTFGVAMRLDELRKRAFEQNSAAGIVHHLEF